MASVQTRTIGRQTAANKRHRRDVWSRERARIRRGGKPSEALRRLGKLIWITVKAPSALNLFHAGERGPTAQFLNDLRDNTRREGIGVRIDLSAVTKITPTGAVMLLAELHRAAKGQALSSLRIIRCDDPVVHAVMCQIGIYDTGEPPTPEAGRDDVRHWRTATGVASDGEKGGEILQAVEGRLADALSRDLYAGIVEAMTNTVHHAYAGSSGAGLRRFIGKRWWALSQERDGMLNITFCDLGIGIPKSLPRSATFSSGLVRTMYKRLGLDRSDANAIRVAIALGQTSTGQQGRGRGLSEIVEAANLSNQPRVLISSNRGMFVSFDGKTDVYDHTHSIRGTLIDWNVRIADKVDDGGA